LEDIAMLDALGPDQARIAKALAFFYFRVGDGNPFDFCPRFDDNQISNWWEGDYTESLWRQAALNFRDPEVAGRMMEQVEELSDFLLDDSRAQYYNRKEFNFMRTVPTVTGD
jgi:hypothetical protein